MTLKGLSFEELFDPEFLDAVSRWSFAGRRVAPAGRHGARLSPERGGGTEFKDFRAYSPGDDLRAVDWNIYRRLGRVFVRLFEQEENLPVYLMPDLSGSLFFEGTDGPALVACLRGTLALGAVGLGHGDSVGLFPFGDELHTVFRSKAGSSQIMSLARHLARLAETPSGQGTQLAASLRRFGQLGLRRGLLIVISDFFSAEDLGALEQAFRAQPHALLLVQLVRPSDAEPALSGEVRLTDCETGASAELSITPRVLERYREAYAAFNDGLEKLALRRGGQLLRVDTVRPLLPQLAGLLERGGLKT